MGVFKSLLLVISCVMGLIVFITAWDWAVNWLFDKLGLQ